MIIATRNSSRDERNENSAQ